MRVKKCVGFGAILPLTSRFSLLASVTIESVVITAQPGFQSDLGEPLNLACTVVATGLKEIIWRGSGLAKNDTEVTTNISAGVSNLTIQALSASDLDHYSCEAVAGSIVKNTSAIITTNSKCVILLNVTGC